jgi:hypothetical protein
MLAWLHVHYTGLLTPSAVRDFSNQAAEQNCFESVKYLRQLYSAHTETCAKFACASGNVEMVQYLIASGCSVSDSASQIKAATCSAAHMLAYLRDAGHGVWDQAALNRLLVEAGMHGQIEPLKWLRAQGAQWPNTVCRPVYERHRCWALSTLQYAIENGCPWGDWPYGVCAELVAQHYSEEVEWAHANGCPCGDDCPAR